MATSQHGRLFNALDGRELKRKILNEIEDALDSDDRFGRNITFPKVSFTFTLDLKVYPREPEHLQVQVSREFGESSAEPMESSYSGSAENQHPDKVRQEIDAPIPYPQKVKHVGVVDLTAAQMEQAQAEEEPLIIPATEIPKQAPGPREKVVVTGLHGSREETVEIAGHSVPGRPIEIPRSPVKRVSINNPAAIDDNWAEKNLGARPVEVEDKTR